MGRAGRRIVRARQHAGGGVHEGAARTAQRLFAPRAGRLGDPAPQPERGAARVVRPRLTRHRPSPLALGRADGTPWRRGRNREEEAHMTVLVLVRAVAKPGKGAAVVEMLTPFVGEDTGMEGCSRIEMAVDATARTASSCSRNGLRRKRTRPASPRSRRPAAWDDFVALLAEDPVRTYHASLERIDDGRHHSAGRPPGVRARHPPGGRATVLANKPGRAVWDIPVDRRRMRRRGRLPPRKPKPRNGECGS